MRPSVKIWTPPGDKSITHRALIFASLCEGTSQLYNPLICEDTLATLEALRQLGIDIILREHSQRYMASGHRGGRAGMVFQTPEAMRACTQLLLAFEKSEAERERELPAGKFDAVLKPYTFENARTQNVMTITGKGLRGLSASQKIIDCKNSATTLRLLTGVLAAQPFASQLTGDASLRRRPMKALVAHLNDLGAHVACSPEGTAPIRIYPLSSRGALLRGISINVTSPSAQFKSALQFFSLCAGFNIEIQSPFQTRDHTERLFSFFGYPPQPKRLVIPGDFSSAAFMLTLQILNPSLRFQIQNVGLNPTRTGFLDVLQKMGVHFQVQYQNSNLLTKCLSHHFLDGLCQQTDSEIEPYGSLDVQSANLQGMEISGRLIPRCIDEFPLIALLATQAQGKTVVKDASWLKTKETDRIQTICESLSKLGAKIYPQSDGFEVEGPTVLKGASVSSYGDHRIAMMLCIANTISLGEIEIDDIKCIDVSFPGFLKEFQSFLVLRHKWRNARNLKAVHENKNT